MYCDLFSSCPIFAVLPRQIWLVGCIWLTELQVVLSVLECGRILVFNECDKIVGRWLLEIHWYFTTS